jgi:hypothetical protein
MCIIAALLQHYNFSFIWVSQSQEVLILHAYAVLQYKPVNKLFLILLTVKYLYPITDKSPATEPMMAAPCGPIIKSALVPTATPPASVAF